MSYTPKSKTFTEIWELIDSVYEDSDFGSKELLIGLFWEETMFQNRKQLYGPAVGFGQVEPQIIKVINKHFSKGYNETLILISDHASVRITIDVLNMLRSKLSTARGVLDGYAGTKHRPQNGLKVEQWLKCEAILQNGGFDAETVTNALKAAEPNHSKAVSSVVDV
jgi:hypothetical protein